MESELILLISKSAVFTAQHIAKFAGLHVAVVSKPLPSATNGITGLVDPSTADDHFVVISRAPLDAIRAASILNAKGMASVKPDDIVSEL